MLHHEEIAQRLPRRFGVSRVAQRDLVHRIRRDGVGPASDGETEVVQVANLPRLQNDAAFAPQALAVCSDDFSRCAEAADNVGRDGAARNGEFNRRVQRLINGGQRQMRVNEKFVRFIAARIVQNQQCHTRRHRLTGLLLDSLQRAAERLAFVVGDVNRANDQAGQRFAGNAGVRGAQLLQPCFG
ncbi:MAG: hypothetical protein JMDDDDMK_04240 [Acidobacteria bacterium]|nr:hypothetical protein [Acidobacteriota bacterium]